ncbi:MAG: hypothetical protein H7Y00_14110 [Fimbriimonadaceae bacterium]|nr:hypothetical protein [Chitinophagales bacterium]
MNANKIKKQVRCWVILFIIALALSGITAIPLKGELAYLMNQKEFFTEAMNGWIERVYTGITETDAAYPFIAYGTDWLAFAHVVIALLFIGVLKDPVKNKWIIDWAIMCCILILPVAFIFGPIRDIPMFHILLDCSFGIVGIIPLMIVKNKIRLLETISGNNPD